MSGANYEWCPGCERKALYVGEDDVPDGVEVWHAECRAKAEASAAAGAASVQRELDRQLAFNSVATYVNDQGERVPFADLLGDAITPATEGSPA